MLSLEVGVFLHAELSLPVHSPKCQTSETDGEGRRHGVAPPGLEESERVGDDGGEGGWLAGTQTRTV